jgi:hypothetical protein
MRCGRMLMHKHVALLLLLSSLQLALQSDAAAPQRLRQPLEPSPATWKEASERCAALGHGLAPRELAEQAAADGLFFGRGTTHECTQPGSDTMVVWIDVRDGIRMDPAELGGPGPSAGEQCPALLFNHTSRQAHATADACERRRCFLCSAPQAGLHMSATVSVQTGRRLMVADSSNCNMAGRIPPVALLKLPIVSTERMFCALRSERQLLLSGAAALKWGGWADRSDCHCGEWPAGWPYVHWWPGVECNSSGAVIIL